MYFIKLCQFDIISHCRTPSKREQENFHSLIFQFQVRVQEKSSLHHEFYKKKIFMTLKVKINSFSWLHEILSQKMVSQWHIFSKKFFERTFVMQNGIQCILRLSLYCTCQIDPTFYDFPMMLRKYLILTIKHCHTFKFFYHVSSSTLLSVCCFSLVVQFSRQVDLTVMITDYHSKV